ncbi:hypothetical protein U0070_003825 [Myodes glareolus]|uniref:Uncharacterized protein n=1 Tax=Myodes glareolus TaxID=447135 RepID=A0AAW0H631_MYOGA
MGPVAVGQFHRSFRRDNLSPYSYVSTSSHNHSTFPLKGLDRTPIPPRTWQNSLGMHPGQVETSPTFSDKGVPFPVLQRFPTEVTYTLQPSATSVHVQQGPQTMVSSSQKYSNYTPSAQYSQAYYPTAPINSIVNTLLKARSALSAERQDYLYDIRSPEYIYTIHTAQPLENSTIQESATIQQSHVKMKEQLNHNPSPSSVVFVQEGLPLSTQQAQILAPLDRSAEWKQYAWPKSFDAAGSMSGGQQLQLAALWPWLLMATLHAGFGRTGPVLAAAVESERSAEQRAIIRVIPLKMDPTGKLNLTLEGVFAGVAEIDSISQKRTEMMGKANLANSAQSKAQRYSNLSFVGARRPGLASTMALQPWYSVHNTKTQGMQEHTVEPSPSD